MNAVEIAQIFENTRREISHYYRDRPRLPPDDNAIARLVAGAMQAQAIERATDKLCKAIEEWS